MTQDQGDVRRQILTILEQVADQSDLTSLAGRLGVAPNTIAVFRHRIHSKSHTPKVETIARYAEALDVTITYSAHLTMPDGTTTVVTGPLPTKDQA